MIPYSRHITPDDKVQLLYKTSYVYGKLCIDMLVSVCISEFGDIFD